MHSFLGSNWSSINFSDFSSLRVLSYSLISCVNSLKWWVDGLLFLGGFLWWQSIYLSTPTYFDLLKFKYFHYLFLNYQPYSFLIWFYASKTVPLHPKNPNTIIQDPKFVHIPNLTLENLEQTNANPKQGCFASSQT